MIRFFVLVGLIGGLAVAYLTTMSIGPISQLPPPESLLTKFRAEGFVPENLSLEEDEAAEDLGVFEVPVEDEVHLEAAQAAFDEMMGGMEMGGMNMETTDSASMDMGTTDGGGMDMAGSGQATGGASMDLSAADGGSMNMAQGGMEMGKGGLLVSEDGAFDREVVLTMSEWNFSEMMLNVKVGERIRFTVKNSGQIPHEFMFMSPPLMQAVTYRAIRADWSLFEHEALFEKALVLPSGEFSFVLKVQKPGSWMFMCMLPYHMQMGMMGQMATEGMAMDMGM